MTTPSNADSRRSFILKSSMLGAGLFAAPEIGPPITTANPDEYYLIGPRKGYSPQVGTLLSMMEMMRHWLLGSASGLTVEQLDWQLDDQSNSIGAILMHVAATERYYQLSSFDGYEWGTWDDSIKQEWDPAMNLGKEGREKIKGNPYEYYVEKLNYVRDITKSKFAEIDDAWLMEIDPEGFEGKQTNNFCFWFHVCEHEANHRGQIALLKKRLVN